jgi:predicted enzyme related to lactoylglutathione lyase
MIALSAIRVFVRDLERAKDFYERVLGLVLLDDGSQYDYCIFESRSVRIILERVLDGAPPDERALVARFIGLSFETSDIAEEHRRLVGLGVLFTSEPAKQFWGGWLATFEDSSGNSLQLVQYTRSE